MARKGPSKWMTYRPGDLVDLSNAGYVEATSYRSSKVRNSAQLALDSFETAVSHLNPGSDEWALANTYRLKFLELAGTKKRCKGAHQAKLKEYKQERDKEIDDLMGSTTGTFIKDLAIDLGVGAAIFSLFGLAKYFGKDIDPELFGGVRVGTSIAAGIIAEGLQRKNRNSKLTEIRQKYADLKSDARELYKSIMKKEYRVAYEILAKAWNETYTEDKVAENFDDVAAMYEDMY
jgi:hypothetical protein